MPGASTSVSTRSRSAPRAAHALATLSQIERGIDRPFSTLTYRRLETALQWEPGTVDAILAQRMSKVAERRLVVGPSGVAVDGRVEDDAELLARVSDAALLAEIERRFRRQVRFIST